MARTKRKKQNGDDVRRLTGRWVFEMAYLLIDESEAPMERSEAFRQAHLVRRLLEQLGQGAVTFRYRKADGSLRAGASAHGDCPRVQSPCAHEIKHEGGQSPGVASDTVGTVP